MMDWHSPWFLSLYKHFSLKSFVCNVVTGCQKLKFNKDSWGFFPPLPHSASLCQRILVRLNVEWNHLSTRWSRDSTKDTDWKEWSFVPPSAAECVQCGTKDLMYFLATTHKTTTDSTPVCTQSGCSGNASSPGVGWLKKGKKEFCLILQNLIIVSVVADGKVRTVHTLSRWVFTAFQKRKGVAMRWRGGVFSWNILGPEMLLLTTASFMATWNNYFQEDNYHKASRVSRWLSSFGLPQRPTQSKHLWGGTYNRVCPRFEVEWDVMALF